MKFPRLRLPKLSKSFADQVRELEQKTEDPKALMRRLAAKKRTEVDDLIVKNEATEEEVKKTKSADPKKPPQDKHVTEGHEDKIRHDTHSPEISAPSEGAQDTFLKIMEEEPIFEGRIGLLIALIVFFRNHRKQVAKKADAQDLLFNYLGLDENNLMQMMLAVFGKNHHYDEPHEILMLLDSKKRALEIVMRDLLEITEETTEATMKAKLYELADRTKGFKEILSNPTNPAWEDLANRIAEADYQLDEGMVKKAAKELNIQQHSGSLKKFDEEAIKELLKANQAHKKSHH